MDTIIYGKIDDLEDSLKLMGNELNHSILKTLWVADLCTNGSQGYVYCSSEILTALIGDEMIEKSSLAKSKYAEAVSKTGVHIGKYFKWMINSTDTVFDDLSTITQLLANSTATSLVVANSVGRSILLNQSSWFTNIASSSTALSIIVSNSSALSTILNTTSIRDSWFGNDTTLNKLYGTTSAVNIMNGSSDLLKIIFNDARLLNRMVKSSTAKVLGMQGQSYLEELKTSLTNTTYWNAYSIPLFDPKTSSSYYTTKDKNSPSTSTEYSYEGYMEDFNGFAYIEQISVSADGHSFVNIIYDGTTALSREIFRCQSSSYSYTSNVDKFAYRSVGTTKSSRSNIWEQYTEVHYKNVIKYVAK